ncbi:hypothetical protein P9858_08665 [Niallia circulans]|uniref:hypothetical protein n=1 Tax=Niallia circulans TaxID=1397 RepID=UPI002E225756|nr:hypothetical protein [Niallia circulans]
MNTTIQEDRGKSGVHQANEATIPGLNKKMVFIKRRFKTKRKGAFLPTPFL